MATTVEIPEGVLGRAMKVARTQSPQETIVQALEEFARRHDQAELIKLLGTSDGFMTPEELDRMRDAN